MLCEAIRKSVFCLCEVLVRVVAFGASKNKLSEESQIGQLVKNEFRLFWTLKSPICLFGGSKFRPASLACLSSVVWTFLFRGLEKGTRFVWQVKWRRTLYSSLNVAYKGLFASKAIHLTTNSKKGGDRKSGNYKGK